MLKLFIISILCLMVAACGPPSAETPSGSEPDSAPPVKVEFRAATDRPEPGMTFVEDESGEGGVYVAADVLLSNADIESATAQPDDYGSAYQINIVFTEEGGARFADITGRSIGQKIAILVDGRLVSAPVVEAPILNGKAVIRGNMSREEAERLARGIAGGR
jgi:preprotein translocase subunit SecD